MDRYIAIDCEMVASGNVSLLARVSLVNSSGICVYDRYVKPTRIVTDYRTPVSGITSFHLANGEEFRRVQNIVRNLIQGKILIGHSLHFDLAALGLSHPEQDIRDLAKYKPFRRLNGGHPASLKLLASLYLGLNIHDAEHDSVEDARVAMRVYKTVAKNWP